MQFPLIWVVNHDPAVPLRAPVRMGLYRNPKPKRSNPVAKAQKPQLKVQKPKPENPNVDP